MSYFIDGYIIMPTILLGNMCANTHKLYLTVYIAPLMLLAFDVHSILTSESCRTTLHTEYMRSALIEMLTKQN